MRTSSYLVGWTRVVPALLLLLSGCGSDEGGAAGQDAGAGLDARTLDDDADDMGAEDAADASLDMAEDTRREPAVEEPTIVDEPEDLGQDCTAEPSVCVEPWQCIQGVCTLDPTSRTYVEQSYEFREPEELTHVFDFVKTFAADVAFLMLDFREEGDPWRRPARYGTADRIVDQETFEVLYEWQYPVQDMLLFQPFRGDSGLVGNTWESNVFQWNLQARVEIEDLRVSTEFGFVAELTQVYIEFNDTLTVGTGEFRGIVTRREAENRYFDALAFEPFREVLCRVTPDLLPLGEDWSLADILDCNATPMDVDLNGDGILDGYQAIVEIRVEPARIRSEIEEEEDE